MGIRSIPTEYNNIQFRSRLEARWAEWLDSQDFVWSYEPEGFEIHETYYLPDFYLPEINTILEVKGLLRNLDKPFKLFHQLQLISHSNEDIPLFLLGGTPVPSFYKIIGEESFYYLGKCSNCGKHWICDNINSYHCRNCGFHNGKHDLIYYLPILDRPLIWTLLKGGN